MLHSHVDSIGSSAYKEDSGHERCNGDIITVCEKVIEFGGDGRIRCRMGLQVKILGGCKDLR